MNTSKWGRHRATPILLVGSFLVTHVLFYAFPGVFESWNSRVFDRLFTFRSSSDSFRLAYDDTVVHVDINDDSLREMNNVFYLNRSHFAGGVGNLGRMRVAAQVYDFIFARPQDPPAYDEALIQKTAEAADAYYGVKFEFSDNGGVDDDAAAVEYLRQTSWAITADTGIAGIRSGFSPLPTFPELAKASRGLGSLTIEPDADGVIRRIPLIVRYGQEFYPSLPLRVVCDYLGVPPARIVLGPGPSLILRGARRPGGTPEDIRIPIDSQGDFRINFIGPWERMKHYSFSSILRASEDRDELDILTEQLSGKIVVVSDVSVVSRDIGPVPTDPRFPLSGLLSNTMHNILNGQFLTELSLPWQLFVEGMLLACVFGFAVRLGPLAFSLGVAGLIVAYGAVAVLSFLYGHVILHAVRPSLMLVLALTSDVAYRYVVEERNRAILRRTLDAYFPPKVVDRIVMNPQLIASGERKELTIMFSDVVGFTKLSSTLTPDRIQAMLNEYFEAMTDIAYEYDGTVDKFIGDGLMVFVGDPEPHPDHALRCVRMAVDMQKKIREISAGWQRKGDQPLFVRIGINTGIVVVGNMGSARRLSYTVLGSEVNLAQRFESSAPVGGILISRRTNDLLGGAITTRSVGMIKVKSLDDAIEAYEVLFD